MLYSLTLVILLDRLLLILPCSIPHPPFFYTPFDSTSLSHIPFLLCQPACMESLNV